VLTGVYDIEWSVTVHELPYDGSHLDDLGASPNSNQDI